MKKPAVTKEQKRKTILIAEDNLDTICFSVELLMKKGYDIHVASSYLDALHYLEENRPYDLVLIDRQIGGEGPRFYGGEQLIQMSKKINPLANVVCISAYQTGNSGANADWNKLDDPRTLVELVERLLDVVR